MAVYWIMHKGRPEVAVELVVVVRLQQYAVGVIMTPHDVTRMSYVGGVGVVVTVLITDVVYSHYVSVVPVVGE